MFHSLPRGKANILMSWETFQKSSYSVHLYIKNNIRHINACGQLKTQNLKYYLTERMLPHYCV